jgi:hypothetical protein
MLPTELYSRAWPDRCALNSPVPCTTSFPGVIGRRQYIEDEDREVFLRTLAEVVERFNWVSPIKSLVGTAPADLSRRRHVCREGAEKGPVPADQLKRTQRRRPSAPLEAVAAEHCERNAAIVAAYATGVYSYREIADHFGLRPATVGQVIRSQMLSCET